jgi:proline-specific peptidase
MAQDLAITEGFVPFRGYRTWYRVVGERTTPDKPPVVLLHGGPGIPSDCLEPLTALANTGRQVVFYDQLGCGNSDHPDDPTLWSIDLFLDELATVRAALRLDRIHLLGFSWGGTLALEYAMTQPSGLASLVALSCGPSSRMAEDATERVYDELPREVRETLRRHEAAGTTDDPEYQAARQVFNVRHVCRIDPWPAFLERAVARANWAIGAAMRKRPDRHAPAGSRLGTSRPIWVRFGSRRSCSVGGTTGWRPARTRSCMAASRGPGGCGSRRVPTTPMRRSRSASSRSSMTF